MAKGGAQRTNQMIQQQWAPVQQFQQNQANRSNEAYGYGTGIRDYLTKQYMDIAGGEGNWGGGGGGGPDTSDIEARWQTVANTGGFDPAQVEAMRGWGVPKDFALTGGFSDADKANFRARATGAVPGFFDATRRAMERGRAVSGGYGPGFDTADLALMRNQARSASEASLGAETELADRIRSGRQWGATTGAGMEQNIFGNQSGALNTIGSLRAQRAAAAAAGRNAQFGDRWAALQALRGLRGEAGAETEYDKLALGGYGAGLGLIGANAQNNPNRSIWDRIGGLAGGAVGMATGLGWQPLARHP